MTSPCIFSRLGTNRFKYYPCRNCEGLIPCKNYLSSHPQTKQGAKDATEELQYSVDERCSVSPDKTADDLSHIFRPLTRNMFRVIRRYNDGGVL